MEEIKVEEKGEAKKDMAQYLESLGMGKAAKELVRLKTMKRKMAVAYENYRFIAPDKINAFQEKLYKKTKTMYGEYQRLAFTPLGEYEKIPPQEVLTSLEEAIGRKCFDSYEVAHIVNVRDPLLLGIIQGCQDKFFISQWDSDISISDILKENEG